MTLPLELERRPNTARVSDDGVYRYELTRELGSDRPLVICGLNPSTATAELDDPTIRREIDFARRWGCGRLVKVNAYGYRATDPKLMEGARRAGFDVVGPENDRWIREAVDLARLTSGIILVAWGKNIEPHRQRELAAIIDSDARCIKTNLDGSPIHPLYQPKTSTPIAWSCP